MTEVFDRAAWLAEQRKKPMLYRPKPGFVPNPLRGYPRNSPCLCGALNEYGIRKKWKSCCAADMPLYIPEAELADHQAVMRGEK